jgi:hypothetical protein
MQSFAGTWASQTKVLPLLSGKSLGYPSSSKPFQFRLINAQAEGRSDGLPHCRIAESDFS